MRENESLIIRTAPPLAIKLDGATAETGEIVGYASLFGGDPDSYGDIIAPGAFSKSLADKKVRGETPAMLWAHDQSAPIGRWTTFGEDSRGLFVRGVLNLQTERGRQAHAHVKAGDVNGLSIGYRTPPGSVQFHNNGTQTLNEIDLFEVSVVAIPAKREARITGVKSIGSQRELQTLLHDTGLSRAAAAKIAAAGWPALNGDEDHPNLTALEARIKAATAEIRSMKG